MEHRQTKIVANRTDAIFIASASESVTIYWMLYKTQDEPADKRFKSKHTILNIPWIHIYPIAMPSSIRTYHDFSNSKPKGDLKIERSDIEHTFEIDNLTPDTEYEMIFIGKDSSFNYTELKTIRFRTTM